MCACIEVLSLCKLLSDCMHCPFCTTNVGLHVQIVYIYKYCIYTHYYCGICSVWIQLTCVHDDIVYFLVLCPLLCSTTASWHSGLSALRIRMIPPEPWAKWGKCLNYAAVSPDQLQLQSPLTYMLYCCTRHNTCACTEVLSLCKLLSDCTLSNLYYQCRDTHTSSVYIQVLSQMRQTPVEVSIDLCEK